MSNIDPKTVMLVLTAVEKGVSLTAKLADLIARAKAGEVIPPEEILADKAEVDSVVSRWETAGEE